MLNVDAPPEKAHVHLVNILVDYAMHLRNLVVLEKFRILSSTAYLGMIRVVSGQFSVLRT